MLTMYINYAHIQVINIAPELIVNLELFEKVNSKIYCKQKEYLSYNFLFFVMFEIYFCEKSIVSY